MAVPERRLSEGVEVIAQADERLALLGIGQIDAVQAEPQGVGQRVGHDQQQYQHHGGKHHHAQGALRELTAGAHAWRAALAPSTGTLRRNVHRRSVGASAYLQGATLRRGGGPVHLAGGSVHRLLGAHLAEESGVEVPLDDVGLPGIIGQLRPHHEVLELLAIDREVLHVLLEFWVAVERG